MILLTGATGRVGRHDGERRGEGVRHIVVAQQRQVGTRHQRFVEELQLLVVTVVRRVHGQPVH